MLFLTLVSFAFVGLTSAASFKDECLGVHNRVRALHRSTGPLVWNAKLARESRVWSEKLAKSGEFKHSPKTSRGNAGENLYKRMSSRASSSSQCGQATFNWYDEARKYNYNYAKGAFTSQTGHFTQVVWKGSRTLGCGEYTQKRGKWFETVVTCRYGPPGNYKGRFQSNVLALKPGKSYPRKLTDV